MRPLFPCRVVQPTRIRPWAAGHLPLVLSLLVFLFASPVAVAALTWNLQTVDSAGFFDTSLALDGSGRPHISYQGAGGALKYARFDGSAWQITTVDGAGDAGLVGGTSLALDGSGRPHISYQGAGGGLKYARFDGSAWQITTVDSATPAGLGGTSLALDGTGRPHISYRSSDGSSSILRYARFDGSTWQLATVDGGGVGFDTSLALDGGGRPHISYQTAAGTLKYAVGMPDATCAFTGFFAPVKNPPTVNSVKAGQAIPIRFSLAGDQGLDIFASGWPKSERIDCDTSAPGGTIEETLTAGKSSLSYDASTDTYTYTWKTEKGWAGTCRQLIVKLKDGTEHLAVFGLTR